VADSDKKYNLLHENVNNDKSFIPVDQGVEIQLFPPKQIKQIEWILFNSFILNSGL
jgi:hypothetical protein